MISLNILLDFCSYWWLWWILPFLLGWLFGRSLMAKWKRLYEEKDDELRKLKKSYKGLEGNLQDCEKSKHGLRSDLALQKGRIEEVERELERRNTEDKTSIAATPAAAAPVVSSLAGVTPLPVEKVEESKPAPASSASKPSNPGKYAKLKPDNLQIIEGIGPKMESVLKENGITSWTNLASQSNEDLQAILNKYGDKYKIIDPSDWAAQASFAKSGNWDGLIANQKEDGSDSKVEKLMIKLGIIRQWQKNDLKAIEGIGPKTAELLASSGIDTWEALADSSIEKIQNILDGAGAKFKLADPGSWPRQARLAADGKWDDLMALQDELDGGK